MKYYLDGKRVAREVAKQHLQEELDMAKDSPYFQGRIFYNLDYLEHRAKEAMAITGENSWAYFSLRFVADAE